MDIIRDLRVGKFDALIGINLLREGLDIPECALVAILDADKEGFLRSETSLIQTIGRAARNVDGRVLMYADQVTGSMQRAIDETERRRARQLEFNASHGITPKTVQKNVADIMEAAYPGAPPTAKRFAKVAEQTLEYASMTPAQMNRRVKELEKQMYQHAKNLEFEDAARVRDELKALQGRGLVDTYA